MNNDTDLYNVTKINWLVWGSAGNVSITKKGKLCMKACQVDGTEWAHILWSVKHCAKAGASLYSLTYKLLQGNKIESDHKNNIVVQSSKGNIVWRLNTNVVLNVLKRMMAR